MKKPVLAVLAAGMGSRYGGLKQIDPVGADGEVIIDYSLFDARRAGFEDVVFIIKHAIEDDFKATIGRRAEQHFNVSYAFQELDMLPAGFSCPEGRTKPYGTTHAVLCAREAIGGAPFCVINSDDYYGPDAYKKIYDFLSANTDLEEYAMVCYVLGNTLTDNGSVARGVCVTHEGYLKSIVERTKIIRTHDGAAYSQDGNHFRDISADTPVSMNFWGFMPGVFTGLEQDFQRYLREEFVSDPQKSECFVPNTVGTMVSDGSARVRALSSADRWYGVTYHEDKPAVVAAMAKLAADGVYPAPLWK